MSSEIRCDREGCAEFLLLELDIVTQHTAAPIARAAGWLVLLGRKRDHHYCPSHRSRVAAVLRYAAGDGRGEPPGIRFALRELGEDDIADAVWSAYYAVQTDVLLEAARRAEGA